MSEQDGRTDVGGAIAAAGGGSATPSESTAAALASIENGQSNTGDDGTGTVTDPAELQRAAQEKSRLYLARQLYRVVIPSYATWFDRATIHEIEKRSLPEFFSGKSRGKRPEIYREFRDFMIDTYRLNPSEYLTVTACRRNLAGDVASIMRVHAFLEQWGLINYQVDAESRPSLLGPQFTGHFQVAVDTPRGLQPFVPTEGARSDGNSESRELAATTAQVEAANDAEQYKKAAEKYPTTLALRRNVYDTTADAMALVDESTKKFASLGTRSYNCYTCGEDVSKVRYHNLHSKQSISALALKSGLFPANTSAADYVRIEQEQMGHANWTDQETLLLLEGVEMYEDDWDAVAYHVGTRTKAQCVTKFLQMPIEDPYIVSNGSSGSSGNANGVSSARAAAERIAEADSTTNAAAPAPAPAPAAAVERILRGLSLVEQKASTNGDSHAALAAKAEQLSADEKSTQHGLVSALVEAEIRKIELKLRRFHDMEAVLEAQRRDLEAGRQQLYLDRLAVQAHAASVHRKLQEAAALGPGPDSVAAADEAVALARQNPQLTAVAGETETYKGTAAAGPKAAKAALKPVSVDTPQTYKFWAA